MNNKYTVNNKFNLMLLCKHYVRPEIVYHVCHNSCGTTKCCCFHMTSCGMHRILQLVLFDYQTLKLVCQDLYAIAPSAVTHMSSQMRHYSYGTLNRLELICDNRYAVGTISYLIHRNYQITTEMSQSTCSNQYSNVPVLEKFFLTKTVLALQL